MTDGNVAAGAAATLTATTNAAPAAPSTAGAGAAPAQASAGDWTSSLPELTRGYIQNKGWQKPDDLITSYQNLEKSVGLPPERLLTLPKDDDGAAWDQVYNKLGRPEKPEGYGLKDKDGKPTDFQKWASESFHKAGLTSKQAQAVVGQWDAYVKGQTEAQTQAFNAKVAEEEAGLKTEWGAAHDQYTKQAQLAARNLGVGEDVIGALEGKMGYAATMKLFQKIGAKMGEGDFVAGNRSDSFGSAMTPEAAKSRIEELKQDREFIQKFASGDVKAKHELDRLSKFAYPDTNS